MKAYYGEVPGVRGRKTGVIELKNALQRIASLQLQGKNGYEAELAQLLAHDESTIKKWSVPLTKKERLDRNNAIFDHWLAGETPEQISKKLHIVRRHIHDIIEMEKATRLKNTSINEQPPLYNVWNYGGCDKRFGQKHPGQIPGQAIVNLLLWLTEPFDIVVDPMAGGGTTIDVCKYLLRRYQCFDIEPKRNDIKQWDIRHGYPLLSYKPKFILLDPPYWRLKREKYSENGVASLSYQEWIGFMQKLAMDSYKILSKGGTLALFIQSFLDEWESGQYIFANYDCLEVFKKAKFQPIMEISVNMTSQNKDFRDVIWAKKNQKLLSIKRDVLVFKKENAKARF